MVLAAMSYIRRTNVVHVQGNLTAQRYIDDILQPHMLNVIDRQREMFQQDNARPYTARVAMDFLTQNNINILPWPSKSPDLNPIFGTNLIDASANANSHLNHWTNPVKLCNMNGKGYHRSYSTKFDSIHSKDIPNSVGRSWWSQ